MDNYIGTIIKNLRQSKGITQKELAFRLCSIRQLSRIEMNLSSPTSLYISEISSRLGNELLDYLPYTDDANAYHVKNELDQVMSLFHKQQYEAVLEMLENSPDLGQVTSKYAKKEIAWLYGAISNYLEVPMNIDENYYIDLLVSEYEFDKLNDVFDIPLKPADYRIINSLIVLYLKDSNDELAELLLIRAIENIESTHSVIREISYLRFIYNISRLYLNSSKFKLAMYYSKKGIDYCFSNGVLSYLGDLSNIHGRSLYELGEKNKFEKYINTYITLSRISDPDIDYENAIKQIREKYPSIERVK